MVVVGVASGSVPRGKRLNLGHFAATRVQQVGRGVRGDVGELVGAQALTTAAAALSCHGRNVQFGHALFGCIRSRTLAPRCTVPLGRDSLTLRRS